MLHSMLSSKRKILMAMKDLDQNNNHKMVRMNGRSIIENKLPLHALPPGTAGRLDHRSQTVGKERPPLAQVDNVEDDTLVSLSVLNRKMEPEASTRVSRVGTNKQIVLLVGDEVHTT